jgi:hypothetical protein
VGRKKPNMHEYCITYKTPEMNRSGLTYTRAQNLEGAWGNARLLFGSYVLDVV